jgi:hypothetical protein
MLCHASMLVLPSALLIRLAQSTLARPSLFVLYLELSLALVLLGSIYSSFCLTLILHLVLVSSSTPSCYSTNTHLLPAKYFSDYTSPHTC